MRYWLVLWIARIPVRPEIIQRATPKTACAHAHGDKSRTDSEQERLPRLFSCLSRRMRITGMKRHSRAVVQGFRRTRDCCPEPAKSPRRIRLPGSDSGGCAETGICPQSVRPAPQYPVDLFEGAK